MISPRSLIASCCAVAGGVIAALVDMHNDEVQSAVLVVFVSAMAVSYIVPRHAWRWGVLAGAALTVSYVVAVMIGVPLRETPHPNVFASAIAIIPATVGAYIGVALQALHAFRGKNNNRTVS